MVFSWTNNVSTIFGWTNNLFTKCLQSFLSFTRNEIYSAGSYYEHSGTSASPDPSKEMILFLTVYKHEQWHWHKTTAYGTNHPCLIVPSREWHTVHMYMFSNLIGRFVTIRPSHSRLPVAEFCCFLRFLLSVRRSHPGLSRFTLIQGLAIWGFVYVVKGSEAINKRFSVLKVP